MLSIGAMKAGNGSYYLDLAREDYYLDGGEPPGMWWGKAAEVLGLRDRIERSDLEGLLRGLGPEGALLTQNAGDEKRRPGWDLTFSAPKSVSVLWSQGDKHIRHEIQRAQDAGVRTALAYLESEAGCSRRGKAGADRELAELVVALFEHGTSRALDPQLHTHCLVTNVGVRPDGTTGALVSRGLYAHKMAAGAVYRAELASQLARRLGLTCERHRTWFEVKGVDKALCRHFSKRRKAIEERLGIYGVETASAAAFAALATREPKDVVPPRGELFRDWQEEGKAQGFGSREAAALRQGPKACDPERAYRDALSEATAYITDRESHFSKRDLVRRTMEAVQGRGLDANTVLKRLERDIQDSVQFVSLGERNHERRFTTPDVLRVEEKLLARAYGGVDSKRQVVAQPFVDSVIRSHSRPRSAVVAEVGHHARQLARAAQGKKTDRVDRRQLRRESGLMLTSEQADAVRHLTAEAGDIKLLSGVAGSGKTATLRVCRTVWEESGYTVIGAAMAGRAADELEQGSGIESDTLARLELRLSPSVKYRVKHHAKQLVRASRGKKTFKIDQLKIDRRTVLVVDEAGMIGTKQMARVIKAVQRGGGKVVLVGDEKQLQPIEAGGPFRALADRLGCARLKHIVRQRDERDRRLVRDVMAGNAHRSLKDLAERGLLCVSATRKKAIERLVSDWTTHSASEAKSGLIFCGTNREADEINRRCQTDRTMAGVVHTTRGARVHGAYAYVGDRVLFTKRSKRLGVENGWMGTVEAVDGQSKQVSVRLDSEERVVIPLRDYQHTRGEKKGECALRLGYAVTTHKGQGTTVERAFVLAGGSMQDREISYVQLSRARGETRVYTDKAEAGAGLTQLARQMEQTRFKDLATDVMVQRDHGRKWVR